MRLARNRSGFTVPELMVSVLVLGLIAVSVAGDLNRTRYTEELQSSARALAGTLRDLQTQAFAASSIRTCAGSSVQEVCLLSDATCVGSCDENIPPYALGITLSTSSTAVTRFAEVDVTQNDRQGQSTEDLGTLSFSKGRATLPYVTIASLETNQGVVTSTTVTFERQSGTMRIGACDTPTPFTLPCGMAGEPVSLTIVLTHARTGLTRTVRLNANTGKISLE